MCDSCVITLTIYLLIYNNYNYCFQYIKGKDFEEVLNSVKDKKFNLKDGPLWRARLFQSNKNPEKDSFTYDFLFNFNHAVTDGYSSLIICNEFLKIINDILSNETIDDTIQIGHHLPEVKKSEIQSAYMIDSKIDQDEEYIDNLFQLETSKTRLKNAFPVDSNMVPQSKSVYFILDKHETMIFINKCKEHGVTVHSAFTSILNLSIVNVLKEAGISEEIYQTNTYHLINFRRFYEESSEKILGCHIGSYFLDHKTKINDSTKFWNYAKEVHKKLNPMITTKQFSLQEKARLILCTNGKLEFSLTNPREPGYYFSITNMGNINSLLTGEGEHVEIVDIVRSTTTHNISANFTVSCHTFRGKLTVNFDYSSRTVTDEAAQHIKDSVLDLLKNIVP